LLDFDYSCSTVRVLQRMQKLCKGEVAAMRGSNGTEAGASASSLRLARWFSCKLINVR